MRRLGIGRDLILLFLSTLLWGFGAGLYLYNWPAFVRQLGASAPELGFLYALGFAAMALSYLPGGFMADRWDRKWIIVVGWAVAAPAPLLYIHARSWEHLIPGFLLYNLSMFSGPALRSYMSHLSDPRHLATTFALLDASWPLGLIVSPTVGGIWAEKAGIVPVMWAAFILYALSTLVLLPMSSQRPLPVTVPAAAPVQVGVPAFMSAAGPPQDVATGGDPLPLWHEQEGNPKPSREQEGGIESVPAARSNLLRVPGLVPLLALSFCTYLAEHLALPFITPYLQDIPHLDLAHIGLLGSAYAAGGVLLSPLLGWIADRAGRARGVGVCLLLLSLSFALMLATDNIWLLGVSAFLRGTAMISWTLLAAAMATVLPPDMRGRGFALYSLGNGLAMTAGPYPGGWLYGNGPAIPFAAASAVLLLLAGLSVHCQKLRVTNSGFTR